MNFHYLGVYSKREIQKVSKIPVPLLNRLERGEAVRLSPSTKNRIRQALIKINYSELKKKFPDNSPKELYTIARYTPERYLKSIYVLSKEATPAEVAQASALNTEEFAKYQYLREHGVRHDESVFMSDMPWDELRKTGELNLHYAKIIARGNGVPLKYILKGMAKSPDKTSADWEHYVSLRKRQKWIPIRKDGKGEYIPDNDEKRNMEYEDRMRDVTWRKDMGL